MIAVAVLTIGLLVQSAMASLMPSTQIEIEIEVRNFGKLTCHDSQICGFAYFQQFLTSNSFTSVTIIENGTHIPASTFGSKIIKQIAASKKISFRHIVNLFPIMCLQQNFVFTELLLYKSFLQREHFSAMTV